MKNALSNRTILCPSCGGPTELKNRFVHLVVCSYCSQTLAITPEGVDPTGKTAALADLFTELSTGAVGVLNGELFEVAGRIRYAYPDGFWDEWSIRFAETGALAWLHEDEGELTLLTQESLPAPPDLTGVAVGQRFTVAGRSVYVTEINTGTIFGAEGQLPKEVVPGAEFRYIDGNAGDEIVMLEVTGGRVDLFVGRELSDDAVEMRS